MTSRFVSTFLALFLLFTPFLTAEAGAWYCEGRQCGISFSVCCCSPASHEHRPTGQVTHAGSGASACSAGCDCVMVMSPAADPGMAPAERLYAGHLAALPPAPFPSYLATAPALLVVRRPETRGPPIKPPALAAPSLRAPPSA